AFALVPGVPARVDARVRGRRMAVERARSLGVADAARRARARLRLRLERSRDPRPRPASGALPRNRGRMSDSLGAMAARGPRVPAAARQGPSLFEPRRTAPEPPAVEAESASTPQTARAEEGPRAPARRERTRRAREVEPERRQQQEPRPAAEVEG